MATYAETLTTVRDWTDRDSTVLTDALIKKFLTFAADKAYRTLRVPALETSLTFTVESADVLTSPSNFGREISMSIPSDLIELIFIQKSGSGVVWNQKVDARTFHDRYADTKDWNYYTRVGNKYLLHGDISVGDTLEVHYYRRLPAISATYDITPANYLAQTSTLTTMTRRLSNYNSSDATLAALGLTQLYFVANTTAEQVDALNPTAASATSTGTYSVNYYFEPAYYEHWLRDENEKILLYGALVEAYDYLEEGELSNRYEAKFEKEIEKLNGEERQRSARGGNTPVNFSGYGLI